MEDLKKAVENPPTEVTSDDNIGAIVDRLEVITGQVTAKMGKVQADSTAAKGPLGACTSTLSLAAEKLQALLPEVTTWESESRRVSSPDIDVDELRAKLKTQSEQVLEYRNDAEDQALKACEEVASVNLAASEAERQLSVSKIKSMANKAAVAARRARTTWKAMVIQLERLTGRGDTAEDLEQQRQSLLARIPNISSCDTVVDKAQGTLAELETELQILLGMEQTADGLVEQAHALAEGQGNAETRKLKRSLMKMKDKAAWMVHKNKLLQHQGTIKTHAKTSLSAVAVLRSSLTATEAKLNDAQPLRTEISQKLSQPMSRRENDANYLELKSWVDTAELFVEPAEIAAEQARICQGEADGQPTTQTSTQGNDRDQDTGSAEVIHEDLSTPSGTTTGDADATTTSAVDPRVDDWIRQAEAHFGQCQFMKAQGPTGMVARFAPNNSWLATNGPIIDRNARKQQDALNILGSVQDQLASDNLAVGQLKSIRNTLDQAARRAPDCMVDGIRGIYDRISNAIANARARDRAATQQAMSDFMDAFTSGLAVAGQTTTGGSTSTRGSTSSTETQSVDSCVTNFTYRNVWSPEPVCNCPGYSWDGKKYKCVYTGKKPTGGVIPEPPVDGVGDCSIIFTAERREITYFALFVYFAQRATYVERQYVVVGLGPRDDPQQLLRDGCPNCNPSDMRLLATGTQAEMTRKASQLCPYVDVPLQ